MNRFISKLCIILLASLSLHAIDDCPQALSKLISIPIELLELERRHITSLEVFAKDLHPDSHRSEIAFRLFSQTALEDESSKLTFYIKEDLAFLYGHVQSLKLNHNGKNPLPAYAGLYHGLKYFELHNKGMLDINKLSQIDYDIAALAKIHTETRPTRISREAALDYLNYLAEKFETIDHSQNLFNMNRDEIGNERSLHINHDVFAHEIELALTIADMFNRQPKLESIFYDLDDKDLRLMQEMKKFDLNMNVESMTTEQFESFAKRVRIGDEVRMFDKMDILDLVLSSPRNRLIIDDFIKSFRPWNNRGALLDGIKKIWSSLPYQKRPKFALEVFLEKYKEKNNLPSIAHALIVALTYSKHTYASELNYRFGNDTTFEIWFRLAKEFIEEQDNSNIDHRDALEELRLLNTRFSGGQKRPMLELHKEKMQELINRLKTKEGEIIRVIAHEKDFTVPNHKRHVRGRLLWSSFNNVLSSEIRIAIETPQGKKIITYALVPEIRIFPVLRSIK